MLRIKIKFILLSYFIILLFLFLPVLNLKAENIPWSKREVKLFIDEATILKGYTVVAGDDDFKLGVVDKAISQAATAVIRELNEVHAPAGPVINAKGEELNYKRVSSAWEFDFLGEPRIGVLNKPLYAAIKNPELPPEAADQPLTEKIKSAAKRVGLPMTSFVRYHVLNIILKNLNSEAIAV